MIRNYRPEDLEPIMKIADSAWHEIRRYTLSRLGKNIFSFLGGGTSKGLKIKQQIEQTSDDIFICEENGRIVGFIICHMNPDTGIGEISNNAVDPNCGLKGIGQQMYAAVFEYFRSNGMKAAKVTTGLDEAHLPARKAYERAGFNHSLESITYYRKL